jgi:DNA-binding HxlR family transcriptional regulator
VLVALLDGTYRFGELRRKTTGVSDKMLAHTLQALERDGFVRRTIYPVIPPRVEYALTPIGREVAAKMKGLADWVEDNLLRVMQARTKQQAKRQPRADGA